MRSGSCIGAGIFVAVASAAPRINGILGTDQVPVLQERLEGRIMRSGHISLVGMPSHY